MAVITRDSIPLDHNLAILALVDELALQPLKRQQNTQQRPFWQTYFSPYVRRQAWRGGVETWLQADETVLHRVAIRGLKDEQEAAAIRLERAHHRIVGEDLEQLVERVTSDQDREARKRHDTFVSCLSRVREYFRWEAGEVVESGGRLLPISKIGLPADDVEVLRQVFMRLRERSFRPSDKIKVEDEACPTCGSDGKPKRSVVKDLKAARGKVRQHSGAYADAGFAAWVDQCLQTKTDDWSRARTPLYAHYCEWVRKGGHGGNRGEKAEAKATVLSEVRWGRLMRLRFPDAWRQDKQSILYRVTVKKGA